MITRLRVNGFKNLVDLDVYFGPVTCLAGVNGVGKSNLFDAIDFLRRSADETLLNAALGVRSDSGAADVRRIFHHDGLRFVDQIEFDVEMIIPESGKYDLVQDLHVTAMFLRYELVIGWRAHQGGGSGPLEIRKEALTHIAKGEAGEHLPFPHSKRNWRDQVVGGNRRGHRSAPFISTTIEEGRKVVKLHQDGQGKPRPFLLDNLPRTLLSTATKADGPTVSLARVELRSWMQLHLEPSAMRSPAEFLSAPSIQANGEGLAATLFDLAKQENPAIDTPLSGAGRQISDQSAVYSRIGNRLMDLVDIDRVWVERDHIRRLLHIMVRERNGSEFPASSLSDGTLRFLALAVLEEDQKHGGVICIEEPENGIHPSRIPMMLDLLQAIAVDVQRPVENGNPNRQIIFNTHSPFVVENMLRDDLLFARKARIVREPGSEVGPGKQRFDTKVELLCMQGSWRSRLGAKTCPPGLVFEYLEAPQMPDEDRIGKQMRLEFQELKDIA